MSDKIHIAELRRGSDAAIQDTDANWLVIELNPEATMLLDSGKSGAIIRIFTLSDTDLELIKSAIENDQKVRATIKENI